MTHDRVVFFTKGVYTVKIKIFPSHWIKTLRVSVTFMSSLINPSRNSGFSMGPKVHNGSLYGRTKRYLFVFILLMWTGGSTSLKWGSESHKQTLMSIMTWDVSDAKKDIYV